MKEQSRQIVVALSALLDRLNEVGLTERDLAVRLGWSRRRVGQLLHGDQTPTHQQLIQMALALDMRFDLQRRPTMPEIVVFAEGGLVRNVVATGLPDGCLCHVVDFDELDSEKDPVDRAAAKQLWRRDRLVEKAAPGYVGFDRGFRPHVRFEQELW